MKSGWMSAQNSCSHSESSRRRSTDAHRRERIQRFVRDRRAELRVEREQFEQDRRARARRADDEQRRGDGWRGDRRRRLSTRPAAAATSGVRAAPRCASARGRAGAAGTRRRSTRASARRSRTNPATRPRRGRRGRSSRARSRPAPRRRDRRSRAGSPTASPKRSSRRTQSGCTRDFTARTLRRLSQGCAKIGRRNCRLGSDVRGHGVATRPQPDRAVLRRALARRPAARVSVVGNDRRAVVRARSVRRRDGCDGLRGRSRRLAGRAAHRDRRQRSS